MALKGLIFDLGNTLMYFDGSWSEALRVADRAMVSTLVQNALIEISGLG